MSIQKHAIPILEYDTDTSAVILPTRESPDLKLPEKTVYAFLGDEIDRYAQAHGAVRVGEFISITKKYPIYVMQYKGEAIGLCQAPVGAAAAAQLLDWLIGHGARKILSAGSCGALVDLPENTFLVPSKALRDEGTSYHYLPPSRFVAVHEAARGALEQVLREHGRKYREVITWSTDGFFRETEALVAYRRAEGCEVVEMECAALAACAQLRGVTWGCLLYTADTLADTKHYDARNWGGDSLELALELCLDAVVLL
ncbi:MAG: nucleoside phosphorylase [Clostridia bacterium]|nr:nucleoside phosphorylase [Clostridia bacterium]